MNFEIKFMQVMCLHYFTQSQSVHFTLKFVYGINSKLKL